LKKQYIRSDVKNETVCEIAFPLLERWQIKAKLAEAHRKALARAICKHNTKKMQTKLT